MKLLTKAKKVKDQDKRSPPFSQALIEEFYFMNLSEKMKKLSKLYFESSLFFKFSVKLNLKYTVLSFIEPLLTKSHPANSYTPNKGNNSYASVPLRIP